MTQHQAMGWVILVGVPLLLAIWVISVVPLGAWIALAALAFVLVFMCRGPLHDALTEAKQKNRVQALKREITRLEAERTGLKAYGYFGITPAEFKQELADLERKLEVARQDLRSIWKLSDGW